MGLTILLLVLEAAVRASDERIDGRVDPPSGRNEALAVPRILLAPPRLLFRALQYPIGALAAWNEREHAFQRLVAAITWRGGRIGIRPAFQFTRDFRPLVGATFFFNDALGGASRLTASVLTSGRGAALIELAARTTPSRSRVAFDFEGHYIHRDDLLFAGIRSISPDGVDLPSSRYRLQGAELAMRLAWHVGPVTLGADGRYGWRAYGDGTALRGDQGIEEVYCQRRLGRCVPGTVDESLVPGYATGTQFVRWRGTVDLDTRRAPFGPSSGVFGSLVLAFTQSLSADAGRYFSAAAGVGGSINLWQHARFLLLRVAAETLAPIDGTTPFTEIPYLGGPDDLRGFRYQRFRDYSTVMASVEYRWQIWQWADAALFFDLGTTAGVGFRELSFRRLHPDLGAAIRVRTSSRFVMRFQLAGGFGEGGGVQFSIMGGAGP